MVLFFAPQNTFQEPVQSFLVCQVSRPMISLRVFRIYSHKCKANAVRPPANDLGIDDNGILKPLAIGTSSLQCDLDQCPWVWPFVSKKKEASSTNIPDSVRL